MPSYNTEAIIIKANKLNEADKILTFYTKFYGKKQAIAKGVRRITSRRSGNLEIFNHAKLHIYEAKNLDLITEASLIEPFTNFRNDLDKVAVGYQVLELVDQFGQENQENRQLFNLMLKTIKKLDSDEDRQKVAIVFKIKILNLVGFRPVLERCVRCGSTEELNFFSNLLGGVLDEKCSQFDPGAMPVSASFIKAFHFFQTESEVQVKRAQMSDNLKMEINQVTDNYLEYILEGSLKSKKFMKEVSELKS